MDVAALKMDQYYFLWAINSECVAVAFFSPFIMDWKKTGDKTNMEGFVEKSILFSPCQETDMNLSATQSISAAIDQRPASSSGWGILFCSNIYRGSRSVFHQNKATVVQSS